MRGKSILAVAMTFQLLAAYPVQAAGTVGTTNTAIMVNGEQAPLQKAPILVAQKTYVSAEDASKIFQATWKKDAKNGEMKLAKGTLTFELATGKVALNGKWLQNGQGAIVRDKQVYLPLRWMAEQAGHQITWNAEKKAVEIVVAGEQNAFTLVDAEKLTEQERSFIDSVKEQQGIHKQGDLYVIARGSSPNPGYGLQVTKVEQSWEQLFVYVKQTQPDPGRMYPQVISYPYLAAKVKLPPYTTITFLDAETKKPLFATDSNGNR
ncbi:stalk domain-containing protein [Brevibacillus sp. 179-C9.3 HS]|uniref:stalk domain-containing protein n=1 Tax=unclassified Brevibacillus TaxID=2684853 RepID=UPI0039A1FD30